MCHHRFSINQQGTTRNVNDDLHVILQLHKSQMVVSQLSFQSLSVSADTSQLTYIQLLFFFLFGRILGGWGRVLDTGRLRDVEQARNEQIPSQGTCVDL